MVCTLTHEEHDKDWQLAGCDDGGRPGSPLPKRLAIERFVGERGESVCVLEFLQARTRCVWHEASSHRTADSLPHGSSR